MVSVLCLGLGIAQCVWDAVSGECVLVLCGHTDGVWSVSFSGDGKRIVSGSLDRTVRVWDAVSGECVLGPLEGHTGWVSSVSFSVVSKRIVSGSWDKTVRVWGAVSGEWWGHWRDTFE